MYGDLNRPVQTTLGGLAQASDFGCDVVSDDVTGFGLWGVCHGLGYDAWLRDVSSDSIVCVSA